MPPFDADPPRLFVRDGTSQAGRLLPALQDGYFSLAEMSFPDLLAMASEYAALVKFYQLDNSVNGNWEAYFSADETIVIARILSTRLARLQSAFEQWWDGAADITQWRVETLPMTALATDFLDRWTRALETSPGNAGRKLHALLASVTATLCEDGSGFAAFLPAPGLGLGPHWHGAPAGHLSRASMRASYFAFVKAIEMVQQEAARLLPDSLVSGEHDPGVALLIAFIKMAERLHRRLNRFTGAHLDFYYERVLRMKPLPAVPDHACLVVAPCAPGQYVEVPAGAEFFARPGGAGAQLVYQTERALLVGDARVRSLSTLYCHRDPDIAPENDMDQQGQAPPHAAWPSNIWCRQLDVPDKLVVTDPAPLSAVPLMGAPKNPGDQRGVQDARFGLALASTVLLMREGIRRVSLSLRFDDDTLGKRLGALERVLHDKRPNGPASDERIDQEDVRARILRGLFLIELSGPAGWLPVPAYYPCWEGDAQDGAATPPTLRIDFELGLDAAPVVPYAPALHGEDYQVAVPMLRLRLNPDSYVYPFGLLRALHLAAATIAVHVCGCRQLLLHNHIGMLSPALPFQPFGALPTVGSYLIVGSDEAAVKTLTSADIDLEWGDLPPDSGGFLEYYHDYPGALDSDQYFARVEVLADGVWGPDEAEAPWLPLFRTNDGSASRRVLRQVTLPCDSVIARVKPVAAPAVPETSYSATARNGFFKFTLAAPRFAFGHREYPYALSYAMTRNLRDKSRHFQAGVPDLPYTPLVNTIALNYRAIAHIDLHQRAQPKALANNLLIHLHPHGWEAIGAATETGATLIPDCEYLGNLHIGLAASGFEAALTLFFHLRDDSAPGHPGQPNWSYLSGNRWKPLARRNIIADGTSAFMTSGVVTLSMPPDISLDNTVMPAGLYWLRVGASAALEHFCSVYTVYAHALQIRRQSAVAGPLESMILPPASIERSRTVIAGLGKITQVAASSGGALPESRTQMHTRIAERLRHKGRAVTPADYEALILQQFPDVYKVKCFPNMVTEGVSARDWMRPGHLLIVALPHVADGAPLDAMPHLNGKLVDDIGRFIRSVAPPAATIAVKPPVYEQIQVRCGIRLKEGLAGGHYITRLNQDISAFLSPWRAPGPQTHFGWRVRMHDVESFIIGLDYIADVSGCSMLRVAPTGAARFVLSDTASGVDAAAAAAAALTPQYPWSVAVPLHSHLIGMASSSDAARAADLNTLDIGSTFIISPKDSNGAS
ncbi:baseplate J/gp47 family protein [Massilia sp. DJPM01]|uniref:baseplate J/gp47 family protein n=1 Tax=Massilia sp. DJPM01 TaxID=3024404 RepID=UPI00259DAD70|nr:baseplate J/gp47 family protein [Massilia sp. DJPM01]MDM5180506.1 baseplate J/gp47 family protein [Massilia sp. DJPM01]